MLQFIWVMLAFILQPHRIAEVPLLTFEVEKLIFFKGQAISHLTPAKQLKIENLRHLKVSTKGSWSEGLTKHIYAGKEITI